MYWDCPNCGCQQIIIPDHCPQCGLPRDVAAEPGQPPEASVGSPVGSQTTEVDPPPSGKSGAAPSSLKSRKTDPDWGKK